MKSSGLDAHAGTARWGIPGFVDLNTDGSVYLMCHQTHTRRNMMNVSSNTTKQWICFGVYTYKLRDGFVRRLVIQILNCGWVLLGHVSRSHELPQHRHRCLLTAIR